MSRVFRALEKAEREKQERLKEEPFPKILQEMPVSKSQKDTVRPQVERAEIIKLSHGDETPLRVGSENSFAAQEFRKLRTHIFHWSPKPPEIILVTSAFPREGKTTVAVNLAMAISKEIQKKAILIDGDLRKPSIHLGKNPKARGLSDYLLGKAGLPEILLDSEVENLQFISAGSVSENGSELFGSERMNELFGLLRMSRDNTYTVIDSPPIISAADSIILSRMVDGIILVVMANRTPRETISRAIKNLDHHKIIGIVFNQIDLKPSRYYSKYRYKDYTK